MARNLLLTFTFLLTGLVAFGQTRLEGTVTDAETGEPVIFATVALYRDGVLKTGTETDFEGYYSLSEIDAGTYDVEFSYTGYTPSRVTGMIINSGKVNKLDTKLSSGVQLVEVVVKYERPLIVQDGTTQGGILSSEQIKALPTRDVNALASFTAGVSSADEGGALNIRGSRSNGTNYYIDGVRVSGTLPPKQAIEELEVITGGMEARYGDVTGGIVSITTKGPSEKFSGGVELESSRLTDPYYQDLASLQLSGPIMKSKGRTILGYRVNGQYQYNKDSNPPATPVYRAKDDVLAELEANPIRIVGNTVYPAAEYVDNEGVNAMDYNPNNDNTSINLNGKLDANLGKNVDVTLSGTYDDSQNTFTPSSNGTTWQTFNSQFNPTQKNSRLRGNFRFRHRLGGAANPEGKGDGKGSVIQNAVYTLQFGYEKSKSSVSDPRHGDNLFNYGYIGKFDLAWEPTIDPVVDLSRPDTIDIYDGQVDYTRVLNGYTPNTDINPILTRYIPNNGSDFADFADYETINGRIPSTLGSIWGGHHTNIGAVYNSNNKSSSDLYTFNANTSFELVPGGSGSNRHQIQFGIMYEQRKSRSYSVAPFGLWTSARLHANEHIEGQGLDSSQVVGTMEGTYFRRTFAGDTIWTIDVPIYAPNITTENSDNQFFRRVRDALGMQLNEYVNIDGLDPSQLNLDMFSARELNDDNRIGYYGYDYLGNELDGITFEDFFTHKTAGVRDFPVAAFEPNYQAAYIQDKFKFRDVFFRVGLRIDRFDANTKVLKDPYSLYDVMTASDFQTKFGTDRPGNIGDDFKVYVTSEGGETVKAYRNEDTWYFANGAPANDGTEIFGGTIVYPRYATDDNSKRDITSENFDPDVSFEDYTPQINWMPRLAFSFPISDEANFFANYDVLVQRPPSNSLVSPLTYFYWEQNGSGLRNNSNLKPERTVTYEVGFQQKVGTNSAVKLSAYYKELRDMIQSRFYLNVPAPVNNYETFDNLDFATVKAFSISYDLRRTGNIQMNLSYTLQFADGTGSNAESSRGLASRGIQRTLFPMSFDERHRINAIIDYRYASGQAYNGPTIAGIDILANTGVNFAASTVSGRPYTAAIQPEAFGSSGIKGAVNGSRLPWNTLVAMQVDKQFNLTKEGASRNIGMNVYVRVSNLFDKRNIQGVYTYSGEPNDDGFLNSARGALQLQNATGTGQSSSAYLASYQWRMLNPNNYSLPRRIYIGAIFDF
ncbi:MAG: TonB-dependent receptor [Saprospiraceae bacterium]|nr:TonB-dependent receptor [Saprospiraceae bacterium]MCF8250394.1 TonB-dependent receptor [Saprospiraceae bacterium]MCF8281536.1 TonB-dependent receptor [Bacteroidales bacterium]MCF8312231.1 TonB-dependent receptor [Saprospiraceae bacterium]MCF8440572.1 TonB-dependent receptor [Saprospiraceae bacterium]